MHTYIISTTTKKWMNENENIKKNEENKGSERNEMVKMSGKNWEKKTGKWNKSEIGEIQMKMKWKMIVFK